MNELEDNTLTCDVSIERKKGSIEKWNDVRGEWGEL